MQVNWFNSPGRRKFVIPIKESANLPFGIYEVYYERVFDTHKEVYLVKDPLRRYFGGEFVEAVELKYTNFYPMPGYSLQGIVEPGFQIFTSPVQEVRSINNAGGLDYVVKTQRNHYYFGSVQKF